MVSRGKGRGLAFLLALLLLLPAGAAGAAAAPGSGATTGGSVAPGGTVAAPAPAAESQADLVILLDRSGSMAQNDPHDLAVTGARVLLDMLGPADRVAVVAFDTTARTVLPLAPLGDGAAARRALSGLGRPAGQWTDIKQAVGRALDILAGQAVPVQEVESRPRAVLLLTDGKPEIGPDGVPPGYREEMNGLVSRAAGRNIPIFTVGLGQADFATLSLIASASRAESFAATSAAQAVALFSDVLSRLKERHVALSFEEDLAPGQTGQERTLTVPPYTRLLTLSAVSTGTVRLQGRTPAGAALAEAPGLRTSAGANYVVYTIPDPAPGVWTVRLEGTGRLEGRGQTESAIRLRLVTPVPYSQVAAGRPAEVAVAVAGDPDPASPLEVWAQGGGGAAIRLTPSNDQGAFLGRVDPGDGRLAVWAVRAGGEVARQEFRLYPAAGPASDGAGGAGAGAAGAHAAAGAGAAGRRWWPALAGLLALAAGLLAFGGWNWRRIRRREETVSGRLGTLVLRSAGREVLIGAGPAVLGAGAPQPLATLTALLVPALWAPLAGLGLGRRRLQLYIRPAPGVRLELNGRPPADGRLYHGDEVRLGGETFTFSNGLLPRRPAATIRRPGYSGRPLNR